MAVAAEGLQARAERELRETECVYVCASVYSGGTLDWTPHMCLGIKMTFEYTFFT